MNRTAIVVPVRMAIGARVLQSTSRALDIEGLFVRCLTPPLLGTAVAIRLYLPDGPPEDIDSVVVPERELREVGCRVKFLQLAEPQRLRLSRLLAPPILAPQAKPVSQPPRPFAPKPGALLRSPLARIELQALVRVPVKIKVRFESVDEMTERLSVDISAGGMFVRSENPPQVGEEIQLLFTLPGAEAPLACRAARRPPHRARGGPLHRAGSPAPACSSSTPTTPSAPASTSGSPTRRADAARRIVKRIGLSASRLVGNCERVASV